MPTVVRYQVKPEQAEENEALVAAVYAELASLGTTDLRYATFRLDDGVTFVHVLVEEPSADPTSLSDVAAFQRFVAEIAARCDVAPVAAGATLVGSHRAFAG